MARLVLDPRLPSSARRVASGWWTGAVTGDGVVLPDGAVDLLWTRGRVPWLAGPDTGPSPVDLPAGSEVIGLRLRPGVAAAAFGDTAESFRNARVDVDALWSDRAVSSMNGELDEPVTAVHVARVLARTVDAHVADRWEPDPLVLRSVARLRSGQPVDRVGLSCRQHRRRFTAAVGYGPKFFERVCRFQRLIDLLDNEPASRSMASLASDAGYYDQAHLTRDTAALAGCPPSRLRAR